MFLRQGWGTCGPRAKCGTREHLIWPTSEFLLPMLEHNIASKGSSMVNRYLDQWFSTSFVEGSQIQIYDFVRTALKKF